MDNIINYLLLVIIFVFDPLAISLVIAANFAFEQLNKNKKKEEEMKIFSWFKKKKVDTFKDMDVTLNDGLENEPIFEEEVIEPIIEEVIEPIIDEVIEPVVPTPITEEQMDVDGDGDIDEQDAIRIEKLLKDPNLPNYKRSYWDAILLQIKKRIRNKENIKTY